MPARPTRDYPGAVLIAVLGAFMQSAALGLRPSAYCQHAVHYHHCDKLDGTKVPLGQRV